MSAAAESAVAGVAFATAAAMLFGIYFTIALRRRRPPYLLLLGSVVLFLLAGPLAIAQLAKLQDRLGITTASERDVGFYIYAAVLVMLGIFALWQINEYNKRNRTSHPTI